MREKTAPAIASNRLIRKPVRPSRPWTPAELRVRALAEGALQSAKACEGLGQLKLAIQHCLRGLQVTAGFTRPFTIRDEIVDLMRRVDPDGSIRKLLVIFSLDEKLENRSLWLSGRAKRFERSTDIEKGG